MKRISTLFIYIVIVLGLLSGLSSCNPKPHDVIPASEPLVIYPDYQGVTLPCNIAPLNFMMRGNFDAISIDISDKEIKWEADGAKVLFDNDSWHNLLQRHLNDSLQITVTARRSEDMQWVQYPPFKWYVSGDSIDTYLTYRLIEPGYEVWDNVCIEERNLESFQKRTLADGHNLGNRCMNCHTHGGDRGQYSFFYIRGDKGGTILNRNGKLRKLTLKNDRMGGSSVYGDWHPSGRYAVFSTNVIIPAFHSEGSKRLEVYDTKSDICVADFDRDSMLVCPLITKTTKTLETFPAFSADGRWIYFCSAPNPCGDSIPNARDLRDHVDELHYSLCRIAFDAETGSFGDVVDTLYNARTEGGSVNFPKCSPDGRWLCFTRSANGTFPIWHAEARLCLIRDLRDVKDVRDLRDDTTVGRDLSKSQDSCEAKHSSLKSLNSLNSLKSLNSLNYLESQENGTYHCWSHNSRWIAFASKRGDGQFGRVYFMHIDPPLSTLHSSLSTFHSPLSKPFALPQADPEMDDWNLRSYNIPDLSTVSVPFGEKEVKTLLEEVTATPFH